MHETEPPRPPLCYPATTFRSGTRIFAVLMVLASVGCGIGAVREMLQGHFITGWIVGAFITGGIAKNTLQHAFSRWEFTITPGSIRVRHGAWPKPKEWTIVRHPGQKLVRTEEQEDHLWRSWSLRDENDDQLITDTWLPDSFEADLMDRLGFTANDLIVENATEQAVAQIAREERNPPPPLGGEIRHRWIKHGSMVSALLGIAIGGTLISWLLFLSKPWENPHLPQTLGEWLTLGVVLALISLFVAVPLLRGTAFFLNTTTLRLDGDHLVISHKPIGRTYRFNLGDIAWLETTSRRQGKRGTVWSLTAFYTDGSHGVVLETSGDSFPVSALAETRALIESGQRRLGLRPPLLQDAIGGRRRTLKECLGLGALGLFFIPFVGAGLLLLGLGAWNLGARDWAHRSWPTAQATIVAHQIIPPLEHDTDHDRWQAQLTCRAAVGATERTVTLDGESDADYRTATAFLRAHPVGATCALRFDPRDASKAEIPGEAQSDGPILLGMGILWSSIIAVIITAVVRNHGQPYTRQKASRWNPLFACIILAAFAAVGGGVLWAAVLNPLRQHLRSADWKPTPCIVEEVRQLTHSKSKSGTFTAPDLLYRYEAAGQTWRSNRLDFAGSTKGSPFASWEAGHQAQCLVNPMDPSEATLSRDWWRGEGRWVGLLVGGVFFLIGGGGLAACVWGWTRKKEDTK